MTRLPIILGLLPVLAACGVMNPAEEPTATATGAEVTTDEPALRFGAGFRGNEDPCRRMGATEFTAEFINRQSDLVGCPVEYEERGRFAIDSGSQEMARTETWVIYSVPIP